MKILIFPRAIGLKRSKKWSKITHAKSLGHQQLLPNKSSSNHDIGCTGVSSTSLEGFFKFFKNFDIATFYENKRVKQKMAQNDKLRVISDMYPTKQPVVISSSFCFFLCVFKFFLIKCWFYYMLRALKYQRVIQNDIFHVTSDTKPTEHTLIMVCGTQKHIQVVYKGFFRLFKKFNFTTHYWHKSVKKIPQNGWYCIFIMTLNWSVIPIMKNLAIIILGTHN